MNYTQFKHKYQHSPLIWSKDIEGDSPNRQIILNQLYRWQEQGLIVKLKKGIYLLNENDRKIDPSRSFIANQLYMPSYVSLEYALNFYGLIPEKVADLTSVTTKKTTRFSAQEGTFIYQHIKPGAFRGFKTFKDEANLTFFMALPEKAVVDFIYLNLEKFKVADSKIFERSYRFQNLEDLDKKLIMELTALYGSPKLIRILELFCAFVDRETKP
jgi:hypothetical protein